MATFHVENAGTIRMGVAAKVQFLCVSATDHVTGLTTPAFAAGEVQISKNGGAFGNTTNLPSSIVGGLYRLILTSTETNTEGTLVIRALDSSISGPAMDTSLVLLGVVDAAIAGDAMDLVANAVDATSVATDALTAAKFATGCMTADAFAADALVAATFATGCLTSDAFAASSITASAIAAGAIGSSEAPLLANLDAAVSTRSAPGDEMHLVDASIKASKFDIGAITKDTFATGAITSDTLDANVPPFIADGVMDEAIGGHVTAGSFGKLVNDNINATISSRAIPGDHMGLDANGILDVQSGLTAQGLTAARAGYLDLVNTNLDAAVSTRAEPGDAMDLVASAIVDTSFAAGAITSGAFAAGAITSGVLAASCITSTQAPTLANLNVAVSTRAATGDAMALSATGQTNVQSAMTAQGVTTTRAGYLDRLDAAVTTRAVAGDQMNLAASAITSAKFAAGAITSTALAAGAIASGKIGAGAITATEAPNLDAAVSTRATQAQILSDATPFPGARIDATVSSRSVPGDNMGLTAAGVTTNWSKATADLSVVGSVGKLLVDNVNATISSRAVPGDLMGVVAGGITSAKFAAGAITSTVLAAGCITSTQAPNLDAAVSTRATQAQILSDATPFQGARIDAAITSRSAPGDLMGIVASGITSAKFAAGAITATSIAAGAITSTQAPNLDAAVSTRATQAQILSDATPFQGARVDAAISSRSAPGDLMGLSNSAITSAKFAVGAITASSIAAAAITSTQAPNLDAAVSTRATQAQILADATPFNGANVDAAISSRAEPGDAMALEVGAIDAVSIADSAITSAKFVAGAINSTVAPNLDAAVSTRATQAQILSDATPFQGARIDATISSRSIPGDLMGVVAGGITSAKFAAGAITSTVLAAGAIASGKIGANAITATECPTLARVDTTISSRATQAQILSDLTPFQGARIDAAISSRSAPGDLMGIVASGITSAKFAAGAITSTVIAAGAITSSQAPNLDAAVSTRATQAQIISDATPFAGAMVDVAISSRATVAGVLGESVGGYGAGTLGGVVTATGTTVNTNLDAQVSTRAEPGDDMGLTAGGKTDVQDALTNQGVTILRAGNLDRLDAGVLTRAAPGDLMGLTPAGESSVQSAVNANIVEGTYTFRDILRILVAIATGKSSIAGSPVHVKYRDLTDTVDRVDGEMSDSQRVTVTFDLTST